MDLCDTHHAFVDEWNFVLPRFGVVGVAESAL